MRDSHLIETLVKIIMRYKKVVIIYYPKRGSFVFSI